MPLWAHPTSRSIHPEGCPGFCFARQGRGCRQSAPRRPPARNSPVRTTGSHNTPAGNPSLPHDTSTGNSSSPARHARRELLPPARHVRRELLLARTTHESLPSARHVPSTPDSADAAEGRFTASFCRFTDRADSPLPEQPCSIWDFVYLCTLPSHEPHFSSP